MDIQEYIESGVIESYVLGVADAAEVVEVDRLKAQYPEVQKAIDDFSLSLESYALRNAVAPPPDMKERIMARLADAERTNETSPLTVAYNSTTANDGVGTDNGRLRWWRIAAAASIVLLLVSAATNAYLYNRYSKTQAQYQALLTDRNSLQANNQVYQTKLQQYQMATAMMANPEVQAVKLLDPNKKADVLTTVYWNSNTKDVYLVANKLPVHAKDKQYQLWALVDGKPVDAGMLDENCTTFCRMKNIPRAQAFAITLEKAGGSAQPTLEQLMVIGNV